MKIKLFLFFILALNYSKSQIVCTMLDYNNWVEYFGYYNISTGLMTQVSTSTICTAVNNGTNPQIDPIKRKYIFLTNNPGPVKVIDVDNGLVVNTFNYPTGFFPRHFSYNTADSTMYCLLVDQNINSWPEYFGKFDVLTGNLTPISNTPISSVVNNGTNPTIDPVKGKYIYSQSNPGPIHVIDLNTGHVVNTFNYPTGFFPRHLVYNPKDSNIYCMLVDQNSNQWNEYFGKFDITTGNLTQISANPVCQYVMNGTNPIIDTVSNSYVYLTNNPGPVKIIDIPTGQVINTFNYPSNGKFPRHFASFYDLRYTITGLKQSNFNSAVSIYPNPSSEKIHIAPNNFPVKKIEILNSLGDKIYTNLNFIDESINVSQFLNGVYLIKLYSNDLTITKKLIINH